MANAMRKMAVYLGLVEEDDLGTDEYAKRGREGEAREGYGEPHSDSYGEYRGSADRYSGEQYASSYGSSSEQSHDRLEVGFSDEPVYAPSSRDIVQVEPRSYNDARRIGDDFRSGSPVLVTLSSLSDMEAKRLVDFGAGLVFGLRGSIERVTSKVFLLSPSGVDVSAEARAIVHDSEAPVVERYVAYDSEEISDEAGDSEARGSSAY